MTNSIDIFDTAIFRKVYLPTDIFKVIEEKVGNDFYNKRIEAEKKAKEIRPFYNIKDIYRFLPDFDMQLEIDTELENCYANKDILNKYNPDKDVFISDMYLPSKVLKQMLEKCGYYNPKVFVSCEMRAYKGDSKLFKKIEKKIGKIEKHYGDNYIADIIGARKADIEPFFYPALHNLTLDIPKVRNSMLKKYLAKTAKLDAVTRLAKWYAPIIYKYTEWVLQKTKGHRTFFLSRDMYCCYLLAKDIFNAKNIYYLQASRKSLFGLGLQQKDDFFSRLKHLPYCDNKDEALEFLKQYNFSDDDYIVDIGYSGTIQAIINKTLNVNTKGLYLQTFETIYDKLNYEQFLNRAVITYCMLVEFVFCSPEDELIGYKNKEPVYSSDIPLRKEYSKKIIKVILDSINEIKNIDLSIFDLEQILIHTQYYLDDEMIELFNQGIYSNRSKFESIINYDKDLIMKGFLIELYNKSYCQHLFKKMLEADKEIAYLAKYI